MSNVKAFKTYKKDMHCINCNQVATEEIPWGQIADLSEKPCPKCGVATKQWHEHMEANHKKANSEINNLAEAITKLAEAIKSK